MVLEWLAGGAAQEQRHRILVAVVWFHALLMVVGKILYGYDFFGWGAVIFLVLALLGTFGRGLCRETRSCVVAAALLTASFTLLYVSQGALEAHLHVLLMVALLGLYHLRAPLVFAVTVIFAHHFTVALILGDGRIFAETYNLHPLILVFVHTGFAAAIAVVSRLRVRTTENLKSQLDEVSHAFSETADIAKRGQHRAQYAEQARDQFFSIVAHQLKTPLTIIKGYADLLLSNECKAEDPKIRSMYLNRIVASSDGIDRIIDMGLNVAGGEIFVSSNREGSITIEDIDDCVRTIIDDMSVKFEIDYLSSSAILSPVYADAHALEVMLQHLIDNAYEHGTPEKPITVELFEGRRCIQISVSNWGSSSAPPMSKEVFRPGYKRDDSNGTGLGLWIVHTYADIMSAAIDVSEVEADGVRKTTLTICLPKQVEQQTRKVTHA